MFLCGTERGVLCIPDSRRKGFMRHAVEMLCSWRMSVILPFMFTQLLAMMFFSGADEAGQHFDCYNDHERYVFCQFRPPNNQTNCSEYTMSITPINNPERQSCGFKYEDGSTAECKCSLEYVGLAIHKDHKATLLRGGQQLKSIVFNTIKSFKPNSPTITVKQSGMGNFKVTWDTHHRNPSIDDCLNAVVTYGKRNSPKIFQNVSSTHSFEMRELDPSSDYEVTVRTIYQNLSLLSDSSNQEEFTTPPSAHTRLKGLIVGLCIAVVIVSCTVLYCYPMYKAKYWDNIPKCYPNLLTMVPASEQMFLHPPQPIISNVYLDSTEKEDNDKDKQRCEVFTNDGNYQESCGTTSEPSLGYPFSDNGNIIDNVHAALRQALPHLTITSSGTDYDMTSPNSDYGGNDLSLTPGALSFDNRSYNSSQNDIISGSSATQMQPELSGDPACHRSMEGDISIHICPDPNTLVGLVTSQQGLNIQLGSSPPIQTDLSYRPCHADSGSFSQQENASLALISNGTDECVPGDVSLRAEAGYESFSEAVSGGHNNIPPENTMLWNREEAQVCDDDGLSPVDMDYRAFPNHVTQLGPSQS